MATSSNVFFVSEIYLKENTPITYNVDPKEVYPFIITAQDKFIGDKIGDNLYERLKEGTQATYYGNLGMTYSGTPLNTDEIALMKIIRTCLVHYITFEALPYLSIKIRNIGVVQTADAKQTTAAAEERKRLERLVQSNAEYYLNKLTKYLCTNGDLYPEYEHTNSCCGGSNNIDHNVNSFTCDLSLDNFYIDDEWIKKYYYR